jgi:hypothetical protein
LQQSLIVSESDAGIPGAKLLEFLHHSLDQAYEMGTDIGTDLVSAKFNYPSERKLME